MRAGNKGKNIFEHPGFHAQPSIPCKQKNQSHVSNITNRVELNQVRIFQLLSSTPSRLSVMSIFGMLSKTRRMISSRESSLKPLIAPPEVPSTAADSAAGSSYSPMINLLTYQNHQLQSRCEELQMTADANQTILDQCIANMEAKETDMKDEIANLRDIIKSLSTELINADQPNQKLKIEHEKIIQRMADNVKSLTNQRAELRAKLEMESCHALRLQAWGCCLGPDEHSSHFNNRVEPEIQLVQVQNEAKSMQMKLDSVTSNGCDMDDSGEFKAMQERLIDISEKLANFQKLVQDKNIQISQLDVDCCGLEAAIGQLEWERDQLRKESKTQKRQIHALEVEVAHLTTQDAKAIDIVERHRQRSKSKNQHFAVTYGKSEVSTESKNNVKDESDEDIRLWRNSMLHLALIGKVDNNKHARGA